MTESRSRQQFTALVARPDPAVDLAEASLLIACEEYPDLDVAQYLARLDEMAGSVRQRLGEGRSPEAFVPALNRYLFEEEGFRGNLEDYYDPRNSFLNEVLDRRTGIPITLSTVYMEVGRRAGLEVEGVGLPGHFIVKARLPGRELLIDPFHGGAILTEEDCQERLDRIFGKRVRMEAGMLEACGPKDILARILRNLKVIYVKSDDPVRALGVVDLLLRVRPDSREDLRDRGLLYAQLDSYTLAARDLEAYVAAAPGAPEAAELVEKIAELRRRATRVN